MGPIVSSTPAIMNPPSLDPPPDDTYPGFAAANSKRRTIVWVGTNHGILEAIDARFGVEVWGFVPHNLLPKLKTLRDGQPVGSFDYFVDSSAKLADVNARLEASTIPGAGVPAEQLNFAYSVSGRAGWRPTRVYGDGEKTYIQFPRSLGGQDAPVLFVVSGGQNRIVNYRMKGNMMIVDYNVDRAVLVSGVGWNQEKITIRRGG